MHEWALAEGVVRTALEAGKRSGVARLTRVTIRIGGLQRIETDVFESALRSVLPAGEPLLARTEFRLKVEPARFCCRPCGRAFTVGESGEPVRADESEAIHFIPELAHAFLRCPDCASPDFEVVRGRGVWIEELEGE